MSETTACVVCDDPRPFFRWTDTHGIAACQTCGAPYRLYHYEGDEGNKQRVEKPPEILFRSWYIPFARRYWQEHQRNVDPGAYNFPGSDYEVAKRDDFETIRAWHEQHREEIDAASLAAAGASVGER